MTLMMDNRSSRLELLLARSSIQIKLLLVVAWRGYDEAMVDTWSCGVILFLLLACYLPFDDSNLLAMYKKINQSDYQFPSFMSRPPRSLIYQLLDPNPKTRISIEKIMKISWFSKSLQQIRTGQESNLFELGVADNNKYMLKEKILEIVSTNVFDIISLSSGLDLSCLFEDLTVWSKRSMATQNDSTFREGQSTIRPPFFDGNDYPYWKTMMRIYLQALDYEIWEVIRKAFQRVSNYESANEIWHKLEVVYEGTNQVKESKISRNGDKKKTAIEEAKNLNILPIDDLIGSLISYEEDLATERGNEEKKKSIDLKTTKYESDGESEPDDEKLAMLARRFRKFFKKTGEQRKFRNLKNQKEKKEVIICYECKMSGHIRSECPLLNKLKKKAMVATWDDSDEDSSDEEEPQEVSNLALMAIGDDDDLNKVNDPTYDELYDAFKELHNELMKIGKRNGLKKKKNKWYLDSGCSRHMTRNYARFSSFTKIENGGDVSFGDNSKGKILGIGNVGKVRQP
ncbi:hypothetical protein WN944_023800 [Citrus x changshan-huyou]|uniref:non-specific serine/threonine protein kinase n=1 Tax=Citrus x changshan-huyou TaxID=2935761 RepID=A0AAP0QF44_9ROSI